MMKYSVVDAADMLGISKEAVYNRIRRNTLNTVTENGVKYVILSDNEELEQSPKKTILRTTKRKKSSYDEKYVEFLLEQIAELKERISSLEEDKERLTKEKEELLVQSRDEVEKIYNQRDKQLKQILTLVTRPLLTYMKSKSDAIDADFEELSPYERGLVFKTEVDKWVNLEEYMQKKGYSDKKRKHVNTELASQIGFNKSIKEENGILFIKRGVKIKQLLRKKS